jgi:hypothetical protein
MSKRTLSSVVRAHVADLRRCVPTYRAHGLGAVADEVAKAAGELEEALAGDDAAKREQSMALMIRSLCSHTANDGTRKRAMELLRRYGLQGSPLRSTRG